MLTIPNHKRRLRAHTLARLAVLFCLALSGTQRQFAQEADPALRQDLAALETARAAKDLDTLESLTRTHSVKWEAGGASKSYIEFMFTACSALSSFDLGDPARQAKLLNEYTMLVITNGPKLSIRDQVRFVEFLAIDPAGIDENAWRSLRQKKARLWLETWSRVYSAIDRNFDFNDRPAIHVQTPAGSGLPAGVAPDAIADPKLRAEYEAALTENRGKIDAYDEQYWLKQNADAFFKTAERYLTNAYSMPPSETTELEGLLLQFVKDDRSRERLLDAVRKSEHR